MWPAPTDGTTMAMLQSEKVPPSVKHRQQPQRDQGSTQLQGQAGKTQMPSSLLPGRHGLTFWKESQTLEAAALRQSCRECTSVGPIWAGGWVPRLVL